MPKLLHLCEDEPREKSYQVCTDDCLHEYTLTYMLDGFVRCGYDADNK